MATKKETKAEKIEREDQENGVSYNFFTIKDILLAPYEIDVDRRNFTIVKVKTVQTEDGSKKVRTVVHYMTTFLGALNQIYQYNLRQHQEFGKGDVINLKTFIKGQELYKKKFLLLVKQLGVPFTIDESDGIPVIGPARFLSDIMKKDEGQE